jgi:hypothetical protein
MTLAPIIVFCYKRNDHLIAVIEGLKKNSLAICSDLIIYSDYAKSIDDLNEIENVRRYIHSIKGFRSISIIERNINYGIEKNMVLALEDVGLKYGKYIVIEDDVLVSPFFLKYMNDALAFYEDKGKVLTISGFNFPSNILALPKNRAKDFFFCSRNSSYGWASWYQKMKNVEWDKNKIVEKVKKNRYKKKINNYGADLLCMLEYYSDKNEMPWDYRLCINQILNNQVTLFPFYSYTNNIGFDGSGLHSPKTNKYYNNLSLAKESYCFCDEIVEDKIIVEQLQKIYSVSIASRFISIGNKILKSFGVKVVRYTNA